MMTSETSSLKYLQEFYLAQINIAQMKAPLSDPLMTEFADALHEVNAIALWALRFAIAGQSPGFIWRLQTASGNATDIQAYSDPKMLVNVSSLTHLQCDPRLGKIATRWRLSEQRENKRLQ